LPPFEHKLEQFYEIIVKKLKKFPSAIILSLSLNIHYESDTTIMTNNPYFVANLALFSLNLM